MSLRGRRLDRGSSTVRKRVGSEARERLNQRLDLPDVHLPVKACIKVPSSRLPFRRLDPAALQRRALPAAT